MMLDIYTASLQAGIALHRKRSSMRPLVAKCLPREWMYVGAKIRPPTRRHRAHRAVDLSPGDRALRRSLSRRPASEPVSRPAIHLALPRHSASSSTAATRIPGSSSTSGRSFHSCKSSTGIGRTGPSSSTTSTTASSSTCRACADPSTWVAAPSRSTARSSVTRCCQDSLQ